MYAATNTDPADDPEGAMIIGGLVALDDNRWFDDGLAVEFDPHRRPPTPPRATSTPATQTTVVTTTTTIPPLPRPQARAASPPRTTAARNEEVEVVVLDDDDEELPTPRELFADTTTERERLPTPPPAGAPVIADTTTDTTTAEEVLLMLLVRKVFLKIESRSKGCMHPELKRGRFERLAADIERLRAGKDPVRDDKRAADSAAAKYREFADPRFSKERLRAAAIKECEWECACEHCESLPSTVVTRAVLEKRMRGKAKPNLVNAASSDSDDESQTRRSAGPSRQVSRTKPV